MTAPILAPIVAAAITDRALTMRATMIAGQDGVKMVKVAMTHKVMPIAAATPRVVAPRAVIGAEARDARRVGSGKPSVRIQEATPKPPDSIPDLPLARSLTPTTPFADHAIFSKTTHLRLDLTNPHCRHGCMQNTSRPSAQGSALGRLIFYALPTTNEIF